ncbi:hypothetical protein [Clostridium sp.]
MKLIQYSVWKKETNSAGGKAKNDAFDIASTYGFEASYNPSEKRIIRVIQQICSMNKIRKADVLFVQYPAIERRMLKLMFKNMNPNGISIALIHDLPSVQGMGKGDRQLESYHLKHFTHLIVHNKKMEEYVRDMGYGGTIISLELFDYLHDEQRHTVQTEFSNTVAVAGNLKKGHYLLCLDQIKKVNFELYGIKGNMDFTKMTNVQYKGILSSDEIVYQLTGDYGLVWDGDTIESCSGVYGEYLLINNPHKLSMCMAAGKPVITWRKAAISDFVNREGIGICVDSLEDLNNIDLEENYYSFKENVLKIKKKVANGYYLKSALDKIIRQID